MQIQLSVVSFAVLNLDQMIMMKISTKCHLNKNTIRLVYFSDIFS